jgi:hypothetical protein
MYLVKNIYINSPATKLTLGDDPAAPVLITMLGGDDIGT